MPVDSVTAVKPVLTVIAVMPVFLVTGVNTGFTSFTQ